MEVDGRWKPRWFSFDTPARAASALWPVRIISQAHLNQAGHLDYAVVKGPVCPLLVAWQPEAIVLCRLLCRTTVEHALAEWQQDYPLQHWSANPDIPFAVEAVLNGENPHEVVPLAMDGTPFQQAVWKTLLQVPVGQVVSYGDLADASGYPRGGRAVGLAMSGNPIPALVPCHRVIRSDGRPGNYGSGTPVKVHMLRWEASHCCDEKKELS